MNRRNLTQKIGAGAITLAASTQTVVATDKKNSDGSNAFEKRTIYSDSHGKIVRVGPYSYVFHGAKTKKDAQFLRNKCNSLLHGDSSGGLSTAETTYSGSDRASGFYQGYEHLCTSEFTANLDGTIAKPSGIAQASWYGDAYWVSDPVQVDTITIETTVEVRTENVSSLRIGVPSGIQYVLTEESGKATISDSFSSSTPTLSYNKGAMVFDAGDGNCFNSITQDSMYTFEYADGTTEIYGTYIDSGAANCGGWL
ncbi:hypothetical protein [Salarchaeum sp. JOR-1]|uniref:hypothetical protein n=1 Tax=Salarchaeum sp. JOR-1 TaxID=2599399 RepID=UPI0011984831|nr:hypothetical protein [Salarchaeum sp. JOR-1]QDX41689.1 hypothetical protein FQU85_12525 [Salarchaeum sp. JOR-1]